MSKPKSPLMSLGARGTLGDALTYQRRRGLTTVRSKPTPAYRLTLPQLYQRFDYKWYANHWHSLTPSEKLAWRKEGSKVGLTAFNVYLSHYLSTLPDLEGRYHLDERAAITVLDSSSHARHGILHGPIPATGVIADAYSFDGVNDYIQLPNLTYGIIRAIFCFVIPDFEWDDGLNHFFLIDHEPTDKNYFILYKGSDNKLSFNWRSQGISRAAVKQIAFTKNVPFAIAGQYDETTNHITLWYNGEHVATNPNGLDPEAILTDRHWIGYTTALTFKGIIDEVTYFNRILTTTEHKLLADRRYPP